MHLDGFNRKRERRRSRFPGKEDKSFLGLGRRDKVSCFADHGDKSRMQLISAEWESDVLLDMMDTERYRG